MEATLNGKLLRRTSRLFVLIALCLVSLAVAAHGGHGGGGHGGGGGFGHAGHGGGHHGGGHVFGHHGGGHVFFGLGFGAYWPWYYPPYDPYYYSSYPYYYSSYPYYYSSYPPVAPVYVERGDEQAAPQSADWYYCTSPQGYYPYVTQCPGGWQRVKPQPPS
jgi:hypothetical protein